MAAVRMAFSSLPINSPNTTCDTDKVYDCADNCVDQATVDAALTNGTCDEVVTLDLSCYAFNYDYESCPPCPGNDCSYVGGIDSCMDAFKSFDPEILTD